IVLGFAIYYFRQPAFLSFEQLNPPGASVTVDGRKLSAMEITRLELKHGAHNVVVDAGPKFAKQSFSFKLAPGQIEKLSATLAPKKGLLSVVTQPADAAVEITPLENDSVSESLQAPV